MQNFLLDNIRPGDKLNSTKIINEIALLHKQGILTDDEFAVLMKIVGADYVGSRIKKALEKQIYPYVASINLYARR